MDASKKRDIEKDHVFLVCQHLCLGIVNRSNLFFGYTLTKGLFYFNFFFFDVNRTWFESTMLESYLTKIVSVCRDQMMPSMVTFMSVHLYSVCIYYKKNTTTQQGLQKRKKCALCLQTFDVDELPGAISHNSIRELRVSIFPPPKVTKHRLRAIL